MMRYRDVQLVLLLLAFAPMAGTPSAQDSPSMSRETFRSRRDRAMQGSADAMVLVRSRTTLLGENEDGFRQEPAFYYLTGLGNAVGALLLLDAPHHESWLFVPDAGQLPGFGALLQPPYGYVEPGSESATRLGLDHVVSWNEFAPLIDRRSAQDAALVIRGPFRDEGREAMPAQLVGQDGAGLWEMALRMRWPRVRFGPAPSSSALRALKSQDEVVVLRRVAASSAAALRVGLSSLRPGRRQREAEREVVAACVRAGADRVSFWPWIMTGPNSALTVAIRSLADDHYLDRIMRAGELARVDIGCAADHYEGDVGRTAPVSGRFEPAQREAWDLFVDAYRAALGSLKPGNAARDVFATWQNSFRDRLPSLRTTFARHTADAAMSPDASKFWQLHGVGLASAEGRIDTLSVGQVLAFEPMLTVDDVGLYLEDMILVTPQGAEVLTKGLPYASAEIEAAMRSRK